MYDLVSQKFALAYVIPEEKALEENLITRFSKIQAKNGPTARNDPTAKSGPTANDQSVRAKKLSAEARVPKKGSARAAGHDLYANK